MSDLTRKVYVRVHAAFGTDGSISPEGQPAQAVSYIWREDDNKWFVEAKS